MLFALNPILEQDDILRFFDGMEDYKCIHVNIDDLEEEFVDKELLKKRKKQWQQVLDNKRDIEQFRNTWEGLPAPALKGRPFWRCSVVEQFPDTNNLAFFIDPSKGGDYTAIAIGYYSKHNDTYYIGGYCYKKAIEDAIPDLKNAMNKHKVKHGGFETNMLGFELSNRFSIPMTGFSTGENKEDKLYSYRIFNIVLVDFESTGASNGLFVNQILEYEKGASYDDAPDSMCMLINYLRS